MSKNPQIYDLSDVGPGLVSPEELYGLPRLLEGLHLVRHHHRDLGDTRHYMPLQTLVFRSLQKKVCRFLRRVVFIAEKYGNFATSPFFRPEVQENYP